MSAYPAFAWSPFRAYSSEGDVIRKLFKAISPMKSWMLLPERSALMSNEKRVSFHFSVSERALGEKSFTSAVNPMTGDADL